MHAGCVTVLALLWLTVGASAQTPNPMAITVEQAVAEALQRNLSFWLNATKFHGPKPKSSRPGCVPIQC
jgi:hypothetical protein